ncbi:MAG: tRNA preQ1(34) S-adenosylmethionine ribosyltransferase-isomerase QueA [Candidatus Omnitrophota bacterium]|nr:MAG: tRNA preQ1(34) S-adenosylmethionine ribosyltransferase-isomerase QueA [Candidatus Omnitrophota bacterium]
MGNDIFNRKHYDFGVGASFIAQEPVSPRDSSRLLIIDRKDKTIAEGRFSDIAGFLREGDVLVLNNTKVIKARLIAKRTSGAKFEVLLLKKIEQGIWEVLVKPGKRAKIGDNISFEGKRPVTATVLNKTSQGGRVLKFTPEDFDSFLDSLGRTPLPPYIKKDIDDPDKYQTVFAKEKGAVAAPTAGLHFTKELLDKIENKGVKVIYITLHCGLATFRPVKTEDIRNHKIEPEWVQISPQASRIINRAGKEHRVIAVGTTVIRSLESAALLDSEGRAYIKPFCAETGLYITPGYKFRIVDAVITNFHTPYSTNLILTSSFCGETLLQDAYKYAMERNFRFYSFGDATLII